MAWGPKLKEGEPAAPQRVPEDDLFEVLSNRRRRYVVHALKHNNQSPAKLGPLAEQIAAWEYDLETHEVGSQVRKRVYTALQQSHLPMMDQVGVVEFDKREGVVEPTPALEDCDIYFDIVRGNEIPWNEYYLALSGVGAALIAVAGLDIGPFGMLPDLAWAVFLVVAFTVSALGHRYYTRQLHLGAKSDPPKLD